MYAESGFFGLLSLRPEAYEAKAKECWDWIPDWPGKV